MLTTVPVALSDGIPPFPGDIGFANIRQHLSNYGYAETTSIASLIGDQLERFLLIAYSLATPPQATMIPSTRWNETDWRATVGYDFWQVDRALECGRGWVRLEGRFNQERIAQALIASGRAPSQYREGTIHSYGPDNADYDSNDVVIQELGQIGTFGRVTLEEAALTCHTMTRHAETAIDVRAGRVPSLLTIPDYDALAFALDPVVSVQIAPLGERYVEQSNRGTPRPSATPAAGAERLPPYTLMAMGLQDDGTTHTMLVALVYEQAEDARIAAPLLRRRLENYESVINRGQKLRDFAIPGEPQLVAAGARTVVVQPLALKSEQALQRWVIMFMGRDIGFLREY